MPSHRAEKHRATRGSVGRTRRAARAVPAGGRRRAPKAPRRSLGVSLPSMVGGGALLAAAIGAATAGQAVSSSGTVSTASHQRGMYVANLSSASLEGRDATRVSRAGDRPNITVTKPALQNAAERQAKARVALLRSAASDAQQYARELKSDQWVLPTSGFHISVWFGEAGGYWESGYHTGIDFATAYGTPAVAVANAKVAQTGWDGPYGNQVRLQFENGDQVWYNHLSAIEVTKGETVLKGQEIGRVGETGNAYGYHLHFEYRLASDLETAVDPAPFFTKHGINLH